MSLASQRGVEWFEAPGGIEQQGRGVAAARAGEGDLRAQPFQPGALKLVERCKLGGREQLECRVGRRGIELRLRGGERPPSPLRRIGGQLGRAGQKGGGRRHASTGLRAVGRALQLAGHPLVDTHRRVGTMPRPTIGIGIGIGRLRQRPMRSTPLRQGRRPVYRGSHKRTAEADTRSDLDQLRVLRRSERAPFDTEPVSRSPDERRVTDRLGRGQNQQALRCGRQFAGAVEIEVLEMAREVCRGEKLEAACKLRSAHAPRQIEQSERVTAGFRDDAVADPVIEPTGHGAHEQRARILLTQPAQRQLGQALEVVSGIRLADGDHDRHRVRLQPSCDKPQDQS